MYAAGNVLPNAPRHSGAIWTTYQPTAGRLRPLRLSAGVIATGAREFNFYNLALLPGYARLDLGAYYDIKAGEKQSIRLSLNVQNALDRTYYIASNGGSGFGNVIPGSPISALAGLRWTLH
jgi:iron complex outermembrane recepter protein